MAEITREERLRQLDAQREAQDVKDAADPRPIRPNPLPPGDEDVEPSRDSDDVSPHHGGRAQPGDILGLETGGETTELGDTAEDEDERRRKSK
jgi:hypothetical protein